MAKSPKTTPTALARAEHHAKPAKLDAEQKKTVQEALRLGEDLREELETKIGAYGRWLLSAVFAGDAAAALDSKTKNPVWIDLVRRAGGPSLRISRHVLYAAVSIAARDKRINDQAWRGLDTARKEMLLPIADDAAIREAAKHVSKFNLSLRDTREYVTGILASRGEKRQVRLTTAQLTRKVRGLHAALGSAAILKRVTELRREMDPTERDRAVHEVETLRDALTKIAKAFSGRR